MRAVNAIIWPNCSLKGVRRWEILMMKLSLSLSIRERIGGPYQTTSKQLPRIYQIHKLQKIRIFQVWMPKNLMKKEMDLQIPALERLLQISQVASLLDYRGWCRLEGVQRKSKKRRVITSLKRKRNRHISLDQKRAIAAILFLLNFLSLRIISNRKHLLIIQKVIFTANMIAKTLPKTNRLMNSLQTFKLVLQDNNIVAKKLMINQVLEKKKMEKNARKKMKCQTIWTSLRTYSCIRFHRVLNKKESSGFSSCWSLLTKLPFAFLIALT